MSKKLFYLLGIAVTIILGTILYFHFCCNCCISTKTIDNKKVDETLKQNLNPFVLNGSEISYQCNDNFNFLKNSTESIEVIIIKNIIIYKIYPSIPS